jgi:hypothetical protein
LVIDLAAVQIAACLVSSNTYYKYCGKMNANTQGVDKNLEKVWRGGAFDHWSQAVLMLLFQLKLTSIKMPRIERIRGIFSATYGSKKCYRQPCTFLICGKLT